MRKRFFIILEKQRINRVKGSYKVIDRGQNHKNKNPPKAETKKIVMTKSTPRRRSRSAPEKDQLLCRYSRKTGKEYDVNFTTG